MKKKLEAELISIAHRILKLKNKSDIDVLFHETQKLYETLAVLKFAENHLDDAKPTIGSQEVHEAIEDIWSSDTELPIIENNATDGILTKDVDDNEQSADLEIDNKETELFVEEKLNDELEDAEATISEVEEQAVVELDSEKEEIQEQQPETVEEGSVIKPVFELDYEETEETEEDILEEEKPKEIIFEDIFTDHFKDLEFIKAETIHVNEPAEVKTIQEKIEAVEETVQETVQETVKNTFSEELFSNDTPEVKNGKAITFGLNDRIGFVTQLFDGSNEDFNRVLSQLNTFNNFQDAKNFIEDLVKPDYNDWNGKEDFENRFYEVIENKFK